MKYPLVLFRGETFDPNFYYFSKVDVDSSILVFRKDHSTLLVPEMNEKFARDNFVGEVITYKNPLEDLKKRLKLDGHIYVDGDRIRHRTYQQLWKNKKKIIDVSDELLRMRAVKSEYEISKIKRAVHITKEILASVDLGKMRTEDLVMKHLLKQMIEHGVEPSFEPIVATGKNSAYPHYKTGNSMIRNHVLIDVGVRYGNYCSDLTRCLFRRKGNEYKTYKQLKEIMDGLLEKLPKMKEGKDIARVSQNLFRKQKLPPLIHAIGHGVGLQVHEYPRLGMKSMDRLHGAVMALEPAVYYEEFGVRYEENIYFDGKKAVIL